VPCSVTALRLTMSFTPGPRSAPNWPDFPLPMSSSNTFSRRKSPRSWGRGPVRTLLPKRSRSVYRASGISSNLCPHEGIPRYSRPDLRVVLPVAATFAFGRRVECLCAFDRGAYPSGCSLDFGSESNSPSERPHGRARTRSAAVLRPTGRGPSRVSQLVGQYRSLSASLASPLFRPGDPTAPAIYAVGSLFEPHPGAAWPRFSGSRYIPEWGFAGRFRVASSLWARACGSSRSYSSGATGGLETKRRAVRDLRPAIGFARE